MTRQRPPARDGRGLAAAARERQAAPIDLLPAPTESVVAATPTETADLPPAMSLDMPTPLEVLLGTMQLHWRAQRYDQAARVARDAAPYVHARLNRVAHHGEITIRHEDALDELD